MAKQCETCKLYYPENLEACPHCAAAARQDDPVDVWPEDGPAVPPSTRSTVNLQPEGGVAPPPGPSIPGYHDGMEVEGSEVDLGSLPDTIASGPASLSFRGPQSNPLLRKGDIEGPRSGSMLSRGLEEDSGTQKNVPDDVSRFGKPKTQLAKGGSAKTQLATNEELREEGLSPLDPKKTQLAKGGAAKTQLAEGGALEPDDPKKTKLATGAAPTTRPSWPRTTSKTCSTCPRPRRPSSPPAARR
jgi:hypothetical protein